VLLVSAVGAAAAGASVFQPLGAGGWSWFGDPRALHLRGSLDQTYAGWVNRQGEVVVASYGGRRLARAVIGRNGNSDDHDAPALLALPDNRLMAFYSHHDGGPFRYRVATNPEDVSSWGPEQVIGTNLRGRMGWTYPNPLRLPGEQDRGYLFWRAANWNPAFATFTGDGQFSRARELIRVPGQRPYVKYESNGRDEIVFAFTNGHPRETRASLFFALYRHGAFFRASGKRVASVRGLPLRPSQADRIYDARRSGIDSWVHDVALTSSGRPVIVYAVFPSAQRHIYRYARFNGRRWVTHTITAAGGPITRVPRERFYSAGISLNHQHPSIVYLSRRVGRHFEIERWRTGDGGRRWTHRAITSHSPVDNVRPVSPRGLEPGREEVLWMRGRYGRYRQFGTTITSDSQTEPSPPLASFAAPPRVRTRSPHFHAEISRPSGAPIVATTWDFGDGQTGAGGDTVHAYATPGRYVVRLTVIDSGGRVGVFVRTLVIP
jgi:BNR repeat-containing family member/PKD domain